MLSKKSRIAALIWPHCSSKLIFSGIKLINLTTTKTNPTTTPTIIIPCIIGNLSNNRLINIPTIESKEPNKTGNAIYIKIGIIIQK